MERGERGWGQVEVGNDFFWRFLFSVRRSDGAEVEREVGRKTVEARREENIEQE